VPWACLPIDEKSSVLEKHTVRLVTSGRDLVLDPLLLDFKTTAPVIFADPDFDREPEGIARSGDIEPSSGLLQLSGLKSLPGTAAEAEAITPALTKFAGVAPQRYLESHATVSAFRKLKSPKILVMSTHGYFLPDQEVPAHLGKDEVEKPRAIPGLENPLVRSGLLLAGCKRGARGLQMGVLTGLEIVGTDLRGTELVVLWEMCATAKASRD
jgi:CHAT domain-containing protein